MDARKDSRRGRQQVTPSHSLSWGGGVALGALALSSVLSGCGPMHFSYHSTRASRHLAQAQHMEAAELAPYEFEMASLHLDKAREEAGKGEYQDAVALARVANENAQKAVEVARERRAMREKQQERKAMEEREQALDEQAGQTEDQP